ncbi:MAG: ATP-binding protein, partial [Solirubrobacterales bacterium]|nr:ATP-binding protein [Solirubrobacterales bacterium]
MSEESDVSSSRQDELSPRERSLLALDLDQTPEAPAVARAAIAGLASGIDVDANTVATLKLLVSEIVTNAVIHPEVPDSAKINLRAGLRDQTLRIEVTDAGDGFVPRPRDPLRQDGGYGLFLLDRQADRWGVEQASG